MRIGCTIILALVDRSSNNAFLTEDGMKMIADRGLYFYVFYVVILLGMVLRE